MPPWVRCVARQPARARAVCATLQRLAWERELALHAAQRSARRNRHPVRPMQPAVCCEYCYCTRLRGMSAGAKCSETR